MASPTWDEPFTLDGETVYEASDLHEAVADARFVALPCPPNEATHQLFDAAAFEAMREEAYLLNVARGAMVDEAALIVAVGDAVDDPGDGRDFERASPTGVRRVPRPVALISR
ncbi:NAD(P)-dependent oxidoreductase [Halorarum halophilum]|uniref:NAD(P)-dependent oxidoreductase n=1 Tax=Halorarum halophilum TaxID=2743090 RepID=UPI001FEAC97C|nr:NAD(P)-dependent oxidoreductase [Halobaculum halophilum]